MKERITSAHVLALIALVLAVGGNAVAFTLGRNSVGTRQLKKNSVTAKKIRKNAVTRAKIRKNAVTGAKVNEATLGTVPRAQTAGTADTANNAEVANSLTPAEGWHEVGAPGEPTFQNGWQNAGVKIGANPQTVAFYKDHEGVVHLRGAAGSGLEEAVIFQLPAGYRPASSTFQQFAVRIYGSDIPIPGYDGAIILASGKLASLEGISFRAES